MKLLFISAACIAPAILFSQPTINVIPKVISATIYQNGALVTHEGAADLEQGKSTVIFKGLPSRIDKQSIQLSSNGEITILSVTSHQDYFTMGRNNSKVKKWQDSLEIFNDELETANNSVALLDDAKVLLDNNRTVGGANVGTTVVSVRSMYEFYVNQVTILNDSIMRLHKRQIRLQARINKINNEITEWRAKTDTTASEVEASISSDKAQNVSFHLSYLTYDAGWSPVYDLRAKDTRHPCQFSYKANISQHTGQEWSNIDLTLSSSNPTVSQTAPQISPWYLTFQYRQNNMNYAGVAKEKHAMAAFDSAPIQAQNSLSQTYTTREIDNTTNESQLSVEFHIDAPYTLPSDDKPHTLEIKKYDLNAFYHFITIPKLQKDVFLLAGITKWEDLNILAGEVNIYYAGAYVGKSYISPESTTDTLNFSLGMDKKIVVKRTRIKDFSSTHWIGENKTQTFGWDITLHNSQNDSISLDVFDQLPLSTDNTIEITPIDLGGAKKDDTGKLTWHVLLNAGETKKLTFTYSVKYPKDKTIPNLWQ